MRRTAIVCLAAVVLAACAAGEREAPSPMALAELAEHVDAVRDDAASGDALGARKRLAELLAVLERHVQAGTVDRERAAQVRAAAWQVADHLALLATPAPTPSAANDVSPPPQEPPPPPPAAAPAGGERGERGERGNGNGQARGKGKGRGQGKGR